MNGNQKNNLRLDWCTHEAAKYAVLNWHYSRRMPQNKINKIGVWEDDDFKGVILYSYGNAPNFHKTYKLKQLECIELTRIALKKHINPVSRMIRISIKLLKKKNPGLKLIYSYSDMEQSHYGGIYQASNFIYVGKSESKGAVWIINGKEIHNKSVSQKYGCASIKYIREHVDKNAERVDKLHKHKYLYPLTKEIRDYIEQFRKPYPKAAVL